MNKKELTEKQVTQLALLVQFIDELGFDMADVRRAFECWLKVKAAAQNDKD